MPRFLLLLFLLTAGVRLAGQTDSTCTTLLKLYNALDSKDKYERSKYKSGAAELRDGPLGKMSVYKSTLSIPGFINPEFQEGGGILRVFTTYAEVATYEEAVKKWDQLNAQMRNCFTSGWTFTEYNDARELYRNAKVIRDGSLMPAVIRYRIERSGNAFRLVLEITY